MDLQQWRTLRDLDTARGWTKGQAFRSFKTLAAGWTEGCDYLVLDAAEHAQTLARLRAAERVYASSVKLILLSPQAADQILGVP